MNFIGFSLLFIVSSKIFIVLSMIFIDFHCIFNDFHWVYCIFIVFLCIYSYFIVFSSYFLHFGSKTMKIQYKYICFKIMQNPWKYNKIHKNTWKYNENPKNTINTRIPGLHQLAWDGERFSGMQPAEWMSDWQCVARGVKLVWSTQ